MSLDKGKNESILHSNLLQSSQVVRANYDKLHHSGLTIITTNKDISKNKGVIQNTGNRQGRKRIL